MSYVIWVEFDIVEGGRRRFLELVKSNAATSVRTEPGCTRFDVLVSADGTGPVALYEIYADETAFHAHLATAHFKEFDVQTAPLVRVKTVRSFAAHENSKN